MIDNEQLENLDEILDDDSVRYVTTEKGILWIVLYELDLCQDLTDKHVDTAFELFLENMKKYGFYVEEGLEKSEYPKTDKTPKDFLKSAIRVVFKVTDEETLDAIWTLFYKKMKDAKYF